MSQQPKGERFCGSCGAKTVEYRHKLSEPLAQGLHALARAGGGPINLKDLGLTRNQWDNFQKLRYFGLAQKAVREDGSHVAGTWVITDLGWLFVEGVTRVHEYVWTYRGEPVRPEGELVGIAKLAIGYEVREDYAATAVGVGLGRAS